MEVHQLRYFCAVAETGNFTRAAEREQVAQPSLSQQIMKLEEELAVRLFDRLGRSVRLTDMGQMFLPRARAILSELRAAKEEVAQRQSSVSGPISVDPERTARGERRSCAKAVVGVRSNQRWCNSHHCAVFYAHAHRLFFAQVSGSSTDGGGRRDGPVNGSPARGTVGPGGHGATRSRARSGMLSAAHGAAVRHTSQRTQAGEEADSGDERTA